MQFMKTFQFQNMIWKMEECKYIELKYGSKNSNFDLVWLLFTLLTFLVSFVAATGFNYVGPCRWFQLILDGFRSFTLLSIILDDDFRSIQVVLDGFSLFLTLVSTPKTGLSCK